MTTILAVQGESFAVIGTDSRISSLDESGNAFQVTTLSTGSAKVAENGRYLIGVAGDVRAINIVHHAFSPPNPPAKTLGRALDAFMTKSFVPALRQTFDQQGYSVPERETSQHIAEQSSQILVAIHGCIYVIESDYGWTSDRTGIYAIGTGSTYALGALFSLIGSRQEQTVARAKKNIIRALTIASRFDPHTGAPFQTFVQER